MAKNMQAPLLGQVLKKIAPRIGASVVMEPEWKIVGQVIYKRGRKRYFRYSSLDLNPLGASEIAKDKDYASFYMKRMGYPVVPGKKFFSSDFAQALGARQNIHAAYRYARSLGFPVIAKPNSGSQGTGVCLAYNKRELFKALRTIFKRDRIALVQRPVCGIDYRVVVLDNKIISAYERVPLNVMGDGKSSISQLLAKKQRGFLASSRDTRINVADPRILNKLERQKLTMRSVLPKGTRAYLLDNANLSTGGDSVDVTKEIHPGFKRLATRLTKDMGLRLCGVDLIIDGSIADAPETFWVLEVNAAPGLDHYVKTGKAQQKIVEDLYLKVLKSMEK